MYLMFLQKLPFCLLDSAVFLVEAIPMFNIAVCQEAKTASALDPDGNSPLCHSPQHGIMFDAPNGLVMANQVGK